MKGRDRFAARVALDKVVWISKEPWIDLAGCHDRARPHDAAVRDAEVLLHAAEKLREDSWLNSLRDAAARG